MTVKRLAQVICLVLLALTVGACRRDTPTPTPPPTPTDTPIPATDTPTPATGTPTRVTGTSTPTPATSSPTPTPVRAADLSAEKTKVQYRHPGETVEEVGVGDHEPVGTGDEINTDENGLGILTFPDFLRVEIFVETGVQVKAAPDPDAPPIVKLYLALGTTLQELQEQADERVVVTTETDWATITSVATTYLVSVDEDGVTSVVVYEGEAKVEAQLKTVTVKPGQATYVEPRKAPRSPIDTEMSDVNDWVSGAREAEEVGSIKPVIFPPTVTPTSTSTSTPTATATTPTATPPPRPADVRLISDLRITNLSPSLGENVDASFRVRNYGEQTFTARYFGVKGRGPDNSIQDFLMVENFSLAPGAEYTYSSNRSFTAPGEYWFTPHYSPDGTKWLDITWPDGGVSYVYSTVVQDNPPVVEGVYVEPATIYQGDEFRIKLTASDDFGLHSIRWWMDGTEDAYFDNGDEADCGGKTWCERSWSLKWAGQAGHFTIYAQALDTAGQLSSMRSTTITVPSGPPFTVTVTAYPTSIPIGGATSTITAMVEDRYGNPVADGTAVTFTTDLGSLGSFIVTKTTTNGVATATLTSGKTTGTATITATADSKFGTTAVEFTPPGHTSP
jgi:hypothetical protein